MYNTCIYVWGFFLCLRLEGAGGIISYIFHWISLFWVVWLVIISLQFPPTCILQNLASSPCSNSNDFSSHSTQSPKTPRMRVMDVNSSATQVSLLQFNTILFYTYWAASYVFLCNFKTRLMVTFHQNCSSNGRWWAAEPTTQVYSPPPGTYRGGCYWFKHPPPPLGSNFYKIFIIFSSFFFSIIFLFHFFACQRDWWCTRIPLQSLKTAKFEIFI